MELNMNLKQSQTQTLSPQMMQAMEILQMGSQELLEYIEETAQENPVLEMDENAAAGDSFELMRRKLEWLESTDVQNRSYYQQDSDEDTDPLANYGGVEGGENPKKPLSDQKLCEAMGQEGCAIARRTVAKYRDELGIPGASGRKIYE